MNYSKLTKKELVRILELKENPVHGNNPKNIHEYLSPYGGKKQEHFIVVMLDGANQIMNTQVVSMGLVNRTLVHPREVFAPAIENRATSIVIAHNHPSGNLTPSDDDIAITNRMIQAGKILGIKVQDHIIFSTARFFSFLEHGLLLES